jgi:hypothetical protein
VRSDLSHGQRAGGSITTENVNIVADEADGAGSGAMAVSAFALEFGANEISPFFVRAFFHRRENIVLVRPESVLSKETFHPRDLAKV